MVGTSTLATGTSVMTSKPVELLLAEITRTALKPTRSMLVKTLVRADVCKQRSEKDV